MKAVTIFFYHAEGLLFNAKWAIIKLYHGENKLHFNEKMMMSAVNQTNTHCWIFKVLAHWNNSPQVDTPLHYNHISGVTVNTQVQLILGWWTVWVKAKTIKLVWFMVFNATFNNISVILRQYFYWCRKSAYQPPGESHRPHRGDRHWLHR
jgi:hypothetical protein